jgi:hypothetical protein
VQQGINLVLMLDRVEEEVEMITQELDQGMTWACQQHGKIGAAINCSGMCLVYSTFGSLLIFCWALDLAAADPILDLNNKYLEILPKLHHRSINFCPARKGSVGERTGLAWVRDDLDALDLTAWVHQGRSVVCVT